jgi:glycosyltransferase involved in cell wall biosynthesis
MALPNLVDNPNPQATDAALVSEEVRTPEVSVVMPCLNEADTLARCITKAQQALRENHIDGEIIVADNGSTDGSPAIAAGMGVRVIRVESRGYGHALMSGIAAARGQFVIMGDSDDSYDFREIPHFVEKLREGYELVQGCRLEAGGGRVMPGAMPFLHRRLGNPLFSFLVRKMFWSPPIHDVYCGLRGFTKALWQRLDQRCTGMEFATEMIIKACFLRARMAEVPITLHPDGRTAHPPHLRTFRDGWRTLRFLLIYSPRWLFLYPGVFLILLGLFGYAIAMPGLTFHQMHFDAHTLLFASLAVLLGYQSILFAVFTKTFAVGEGLLPEDRRLHRFSEVTRLERGILLGGATLALGVALLLGAVRLWWRHDFGNLDYPQTMRWVIPGVLLTALGFQTILASFFLSILRMRRR